MPPLAPPRAHQPPYPPYPPYPPQPPYPQPPGVPTVRVTPPMVYVEPTFEYRQLSRDITSGPPLSDAELDELGKAGWELVSTVSDGRTAHFYFKREGR